jgi:hypothetical protein
MLIELRRILVEIPWEFLPREGMKHTDKGYMYRQKRLCFSCQKFPWYFQKAKILSVCISFVSMFHRRGHFTELNEIWYWGLAGGLHNKR